MIRPDGTTTWEYRQDLPPGILNFRTGYLDTATGMTFQLQGIWRPIEDVPTNWGFVFCRNDFFLPGYYELPFERSYWDDSLPPKADGQRASRLIYDVALKTLGNGYPIRDHLMRWYKENGGRKYPEEPFLITRDDPNFREYLDLLLDVIRGMDRLYPVASTLRDLKYIDPKTNKETVIIRNPDWRPKYEKLEFRRDNHELVN